MRKRLFNWRVVFLIVTIHGLLMSAYKYLENPSRARTVNPLIPFIEEMTGHYGALLLFPFAVWVVRRAPWKRGSYLRSAITYFRAIVIFSIIHTFLNWGSRIALFPLAALGHYDYGVMPVRFLMEFPIDVLLFGMFTTAVYVVEFYQGAQDRELARARLEHQLAQAQLQNLRLQLDPHFLFNALNTVSSVMYEDPRAADQMIARLSEFLRLTLNNSSAQVVRFDEELRFLDLYLGIMRARFEEKLRVNLDIEEGLRDALVPQLLLQPLVENSIRHGAAPESGEVFIALRAFRENGTVHLQVADRGPGLRESRQAVLQRGIGLSNTAGRLERLYGNQHRFDLVNAPEGGLIVSMSIPYRQ